MAIAHTLRTVGGCSDTNSRLQTGLLTSRVNVLACEFVPTKLAYVTKDVRLSEKQI